MKNREQIITAMCYTYRHDFGLTKPAQTLGDYINNITSGMTDTERKALWNQMAQVFDNCIAPYMDFKDD